MSDIYSRKIVIRDVTKEYDAFLDFARTVLAGNTDHEDLEKMAEMLIAKAEKANV